MLSGVAGPLDMSLCEKSPGSDRMLWAWWSCGVGAVVVVVLVGVVVTAAVAVPGVMSVRSRKVRGELEVRGEVAVLLVWWCISGLVAPAHGPQWQRKVHDPEGRKHESQSRSTTVLPALC
jgi:hypothetical protein